MARNLFFIAIALCFVALSQAFMPLSASPVRAQLALSSSSVVAENRRPGQMTMMAGKVAKFGIFSPAVIVAKIVLGEKDLNKVRKEGAIFGG